MKGNVLRLHQERYRLDIRQMFSLRRLQRTLVEPPSLKEVRSHGAVVLRDRL